MPLLSNSVASSSIGLFALVKTQALAGFFVYTSVLNFDSIHRHAIARTFFEHIHQFYRLSMACGVATKLLEPFGTVGMHFWVSKRWLSENTDVLSICLCVMWCHEMSQMAYILFTVNCLIYFMSILGVFIFNFIIKWHDIKQCIKKYLVILVYLM